MARTSSISTVEPYQISVNITGAAQLVAPVKAVNRRTKEYAVKFANASGDVIFNLSDLSSDGTVGGTKSGSAADDEIEFNVLGDGSGTTTYLVKTGEKSALVDIAVTDTSTSNTVAVTI